MNKINIILAAAMLSTLVSLNAQTDASQTWRGVDKYGLEQNTLVLHGDGFYKFYEESVVLLEDSLEVAMELGLYRRVGEQIQLLPTQGNTPYRDYNYQILIESDSLWQMIDYEKGNSGAYQLIVDSVGITATEMDFFKGIAYQQQLLQTTWQTEDAMVQWQFVAPNFALIKKEGILETTARVGFTEKLLTFINPQTGKVIFRAEIGSLTDELLTVRQLRDGKDISLQKIDYQGFTAKEMVIYRHYLQALYGLEPQEMDVLLEWGKERLKMNIVEE